MELLKGTTTLLTVLVLMGLVAGCTSPGTAPGAAKAELDGTTWTLVEMNGDAVLTGTQITLDFAAGQISGTAGCNTYFASYTPNGLHIEVGPIANTEMFCMEPEGVMDQEVAYLVSLATADTYEIDQDTLTILNAEGTRVLTYGVAE